MPVRFLHKSPTIPNLGDLLCSPRHYFQFSTERTVCFVGGGAFNDFGIGTALVDPTELLVAWGIGRSFAFGQHVKPLDDVSIRAAYAQASARDPDIVGETVEFVPCVSVLHPLAETPCGDRCGLFLNAGVAASGDATSDILARHSDMVTATNALDISVFSSLFGLTSKVITNSYHTAYWSFLSGRSVHLIGYSTKFTNLLSMFGLDTDMLTPYRRGDSQGLSNAVDLAMSKSPAKLSDAIATRAEFRRLNKAYADRLVSAGILAEARSKVLIGASAPQSDLRDV